MLDVGRGAEEDEVTDDEPTLEMIDTAVERVLDEYMDDLIELGGEQVEVTDTTVKRESK